MREVIGEQGSGAWRDARTGKITASGLHFILAHGKDGKEARTRISYKNQIISERITGVLTNGYRPCDMELEARCMYEVCADVLVDRAGFILHPKWNFCGASPDGLVGKDGGLELKCYDLETHDQWVRADKVPNRFVPQIVWNMVCTQRKWWDFCAYNPQSETPVFIKRYEYDDAQGKSLEFAVFQFNNEVEEAIRKSRRG